MIKWRLPLAAADGDGAGDTDDGESDDGEAVGSPDGVSATTRGPRHHLYLVTKLVILFIMKRNNKILSLTEYFIIIHL